MNLGSLPLLDRLDRCERILLAGAGGGFDLVSGIPLFHHLRARGKPVHLASLSFSSLARVEGRRIGDRVVEVRGDAVDEEGYFPERYLSEWYARQGQDVPVYCFHGSGGAPMLALYQDLTRELGVDAVVLVDGGTDSLMRGDEPGLGTPAEDMCSISAVHRLDVPVKLLVNLGFGVDTHHGVCHAYVLEAVADLTARGAFLGAFSLLPEMPEFEALAQLMDFLNERMPGKESIVATSVVAAGQGRFGDHHPTERTRGSKLFLNPLMAMYWAFELSGVAERCLYLDYIHETYDRWDVHRALSNFLHTVSPREWKNIPL